MPNIRKEMTVLIVDDIPENIDHLGSILSRDYMIKVAVNGEKALHIARSKNPPDIILLDIIMPGMDGYEVCRKLKADKKTNGIPIIFVTAKTEEEDEAKGFSIGAVDYITKPYNPPIVLARIKTHLALEQNLSKLQSAYAIIDSQKKKLENELIAGRQIQKSFFPESLPIINGWQIEAYFQPAQQVSGDFYDAFLMEKNGDMSFVVADICDKGVGAALFMGLFRSLIRVFSELHHGACLSEPLNEFKKENSGTYMCQFLEDVILQINNYIATTHSNVNMFATIFWGILNPADGMLSYINAGHESAIIIDPNGIKAQLPPTGPAVGMMPDMKFQAKQIKIHPKEAIITFTDGITEARDASGKFFGVDNLIHLLDGSTGTAEETISLITTTLAAHAAGVEPFDDITLMVINHKSKIGVK
jgi:serine phosphatase RsbU (regulator of sigma subunit)